MASKELAGVRVVVAGAGLAGLAAARDLERSGARVTVVEARDRVGGRVHTERSGFAAGQHAEAGADLIEGEQNFVRELARDTGLELVRILRKGFGYYGGDGRGRRRFRSGPARFKEVAERLKPQVDDFKLAGQRWDSAVAARIARQSVAGWLKEVAAGPELASSVRGLRGFFLADPEDLSLIALADEFASGDVPGESKFFRIRGGNDRLPCRIAEQLKGPVLLNAALRRVRQGTRGIRLTIDDRGNRRELSADYCVIALPATTLREVEFEPSLPEPQVRAIRSLRYGRATRVLLQFASGYWRKRDRPRAFGTDLPIGAAWDGTEDQRGRRAILSLLAGGRASPESRAIIQREGIDGVIARLRWLGRPAPLLTSRVITWEDDPWARGGYAYFDPAFDPLLREWLSRPAGRILFAGEHTSIQFQGYMNGAVESGKRAAAEVRALNALRAG